MEGTIKALCFYGKVMLKVPLLVGLEKTNIPMNRLFVRWNIGFLLNQCI